MPPCRKIDLSPHVNTRPAAVTDTLVSQLQSTMATVESPKTRASMRKLLLYQVHLRPQQNNNPSLVTAAPRNSETTTITTSSPQICSRATRDRRAADLNTVRGSCCLSFMPHPYRSPCSVAKSVNPRPQASAMRVICNMLLEFFGVLLLPYIHSK